MPLPKDEAWFPAKTYGWGWGLPSRWQGWAVMVVFIAAMVVVSLSARKNLAAVAGFGAAAVAALLAVCYSKGEEPHWRRDKRD